jgi:hypothetical protein
MIFVGASVMGDLKTGQYALDGNGTGYYVRLKDANQWQFDHVDLTYDITGLTQVQIVPNNHAYWDEFLTAQGAVDLWTPTSQYYMIDYTQLPAGDVVRILTTQTLYKSLGTIPNFAQPTRTENTSLTPPSEPVIPPPTHHSIALDATSTSGSQSSISSYSWSHTCTGSSGLLAIGDSHYGTLDRTITGITYNSVAMTAIRSDVGGTASRSTIYYMVAPSSGVNTIAVTYSGSVLYGAGSAVSYTGAAQTGQPDANNGASGTIATTISVSVTTVANNSWVFSNTNSYNALSACGNTQRQNVAAGTFCYGGVSDTNAPKTPAGSQTMSWTTSAGQWAISAASFSPSSNVPTAVTANNGSTSTPASSITTTGATLTEACSAVGTPASDTAWGSYYGTTTGYGSTASNSGTQTTPFSWTDAISGLTSGYLYHYQAYSTNSAGTGGGSDATFLTLPPAPSSLTATVGNGSIGLTWTNATGETSPVAVTIQTRIQYSTSSYPTTYASGTTGVAWTSGTSGLITGLTNSTLYYFSAFTIVSYAGTTSQYSTSYASVTSTPSSAITVPPGVIDYIPITLTNSQTAVVAGSTPVKVTVNWNTYNAYLDNPVDNFICYDSTGVILLSWLESGTANTATNAILWVKIGSSGIAANGGTYTVNLGLFALSTNNLSTGSIGEFPTATGTYAQYDNGGSVFSFYDNFAGSSLNGQWVSWGHVSATTVSNGLTLSTNASGNGGIVATVPSGAQVMDSYTTYNYAGANSGPFIGYGTTSGSADDQNGYLYWYPNYGVYKFVNGTFTFIGGSATAPSGYYVFGATFATSVQRFDADYTNYWSTTDATFAPSSITQVGWRLNASTTIKVTWVRTRIYPPSYTMPSSSFGSVTATATYNLTNSPSSIDFGVIQPNTKYYAYGSAPSNPVTDGQCTFTITNSQANIIKVNIQATNFTGGGGWTLGAPDGTHARLIAYTSGSNPASGVTLTTSPQTFVASLASSSTIKWDFSWETATSFDDGTQKSSTITLTGVAP